MPDDGGTPAPLSATAPGHGGNAEAHLLVWRPDVPPRSPERLASFTERTIAVGI